MQCSGAGVYADECHFSYLLSHLFRLSTRFFFLYLSLYVRENNKGFVFCPYYILCDGSRGISFHRYFENRSINEQGDRDNYIYRPFQDTIKAWRMEPESTSITETLAGF